MIEQLLSHALSIQRQAARQTLHVSCKDYRCSPDTSARSSKYRVTFSIFLYSPLWAVSLLHSIRVHLRSIITPSSSIAWTAVLTRKNRFSDHSKPQCRLLLFFSNFWIISIRYARVVPLWWSLNLLLDHVSRFSCTQQYIFSTKEISGADHTGELSTHDHVNKKV